MRSIEIDDDVYRALESRAQGFADTPNEVLRRILAVEAMPALGPVVGKAPSRTHARGKAPKTNLRDLVSAGSLREGQSLFLHDYRGKQVEGIRASVRGNDLEFNGARYSMSALAAKHMKSQGYDSDSYRGPHFWYTADGKSVRALWDEYLKKAAE